MGDIFSRMVSLHSVMDNAVAFVAWFAGSGLPSVLFSSLLLLLYPIFSKDCSLYKLQIL